MKKFLNLLLLVFIFGTSLISCKNGSTNSAPENENIFTTSIELKQPGVSIKQSHDGNIYTFEAVLSDALKDRVFTYEWLVDYGFIDESEHTSEDGKILSFDVTDFPPDTYFVYLAAFDKTPLPQELRDKVSDTELEYIENTSFVVTK